MMTVMQRSWGEVFCILAHYYNFSSADIKQFTVEQVNVMLRTLPESVDKKAAENLKNILDGKFPNEDDLPSYS